MIIDTGSGCTLLNDIRCQSQNCLKRKGYDISKRGYTPPQTDLSSTEEPKEFDIKYAQGEVIMEISEDYFYFGEKKVIQEFGLILFEDKIFEKSSFDGILGLSYPELSQSTKPFFDSLMEQGILEKNIFSIYLERRYLSPEEREKGDELEISKEAEESHKGKEKIKLMKGTMQEQNIISDSEGFLSNLQSIFKQNSAIVSTKRKGNKKSSQSILKKAPTVIKNRKDGIRVLKKHSGHLKQFSQKKVKTVETQEKEKSMLILGGWDNSLFSGSLHFHPVVRKSWWTLSLDKVLLDGIDTNFCDKENRPCQIIMDSGASLMATPESVFNSFISKVEPKSFCDDLSKYPRISFIIDDQEYFIDPFEYVLSNKEDIDYIKSSSKEECVVGFSIFDLGPNEMVWIAGDIFLSKYYSVYDRDQNRMGLALAN